MGAKFPHNFVCWALSNAHNWLQKVKNPSRNCRFDFFASLIARNLWRIFELVLPNLQPSVKRVSQVKFATTTKIGSLHWVFDQLSTEVRCKAVRPGRNANKGKSLLRLWFKIPYLCILSISNSLRCSFVFWLIPVPLFLCSPPTQNQIKSYQQGKPDIKDFPFAPQKFCFCATLFVWAWPVIHQSQSIKLSCQECQIGFPACGKSCQRLTQGGIRQPGVQMSAPCCNPSNPFEIG